MNMSKISFIIASCTLLLCACSTTSVQDVQIKKVSTFPDYSSKSASTGFDAEKISVLEARMQQFVSDGDTMGIETLLVKDGKVISHAKAGLQESAAGIASVEDTIYRIYSMTKPITGVAMMTLYEQGKFSLDDPITKFIPEFKDLKVVKSYDKEGGIELEPIQRPATMRELMSHTAGFAYGLYGDDPANQAFMQQRILGSPDLEMFIKKVAAVPLMQQPGERWFYSASVDIQGAIIERITGMSFGEYLAKRLFKPLNMHDTAFYVPAEKADRLADIFAYHPINKKLQALPFPEPQFNLLGEMSYSKETRGMESGGGGLVSSMADYARFCQMLANGGTLEGTRILNDETVKLMRTNVLVEEQKVTIAGTLTEAQATRLGFGLDFGIISNPGNKKPGSGDGTYFWGGAAGTWFWIDPVHNLYFIGMIQRFPQGGPKVDFRGISQQMVYGAMK